MKCFLIVAERGSELSKENVSQAFPSYYEFSEGSAWIIASETYNTTEGVCTALGIYPPSDPPHKKTGIVVGLSERDGYASKSVWDSVVAWEAT